MLLQYVVMRNGDAISTARLDVEEIPADERRCCYSYGFSSDCRMFRSRAWEGPSFVGRLRGWWTPAGPTTRPKVPQRETGLARPMRGAPEAQRGALRPRGPELRRASTREGGVMRLG